MSNFRFNKLYIIQSLADGDDKTGVDLENEINAFVVNENIASQAVLFNVETMSEWETCWNGIYTAISSQGIIPIIHLIMHGNVSSVGIKQGKGGVISLASLFDKVRKANELSGNNIFLSMAVCEGLNIIRGISAFEHMPFCAAIASEYKMGNLSALKNYAIFYKTFLKSLDINLAFDELISKGTDTDNYKLFIPEEVFMRAMAGYLEAESKDDKIEERAERLAKDGGFDISDPVREREFLDNLRKILPEEDRRGYERAVSKFFMLDLYPDNAGRFQIPKTLDDFKAYAKQNGVDLY